jgi:uncharacterized membrane protein
MNSANAYAPPAHAVPHDPLRATEMLRLGYATFRRAPMRLTAIVTVGTGLATALGCATDVVFERLAQDAPHVAVLTKAASMAIGAVFSAFFAVGMQRGVLAAVRGQEVRLRTLFSGADVLWPALVASIATSLLVAAGSVALLIPGIIAAIATAYAPTLIADRHMGGVEAMAASFRITRGHWASLFALGLLCALVFAGGILALGIGALPALAISYAAFAHAYLHCIGEPQR